MNVGMIMTVAMAQVRARSDERQRKGNGEVCAHC
jgi:hypothetical protein